MLLLSSVAFAAQPIWESSDSLTSYTLDSSLFNQGGLSVAIQMNVDTIKAESGSNFNGSAKIINFNGVWNDSQGNGTLDINVNGSSNGKTSTLYVGSTTGQGVYASNYGLSGISSTNIFTANTDWTSIEAASLVFVLDNSGDNDKVYAYFTLLNADGSTTVYEGSNTGIKFTLKDESGTIVAVDTHLNVSEVSFLNNFATSAQVYNTVLNATDAKALGMQLIPEPTTATLSLLALAGLAARRRRK